jgi:DNA-binding MarR family transcriptional regulator
MDSRRNQTLGTLVRQLVDRLDGAVDEACARAGLDYRPRYTPVMRVLIASGPLSIRAISNAAGVTHSAVSQTVSEMARRGLVRLSEGEDARERVVDLTTMGRELVPQLERHWKATHTAARSLDKELSMPLSGLVREALDALDRKPFAERIARASSRSARRIGKERA